MTTKYLLTSEVATYCGSFPDVTEQQIAEAEMLIDSFCGGSLVEKTTTDNVKLNRKNRGKLTQNMVTSIESAMGKYLIPNMGFSNVVLDVANIDFSPSGSFEYLNINPTMSIYSFTGQQLHSLVITYKNGLPAIPAELKHITAMVAQNIYQSGDYSGAKSKSGIDFNVAMFDDSFLPSDIRMSLQKYKRV
jgi:hypothetical protein